MNSPAIFPHGGSTITQQLVRCHFLKDLTVFKNMTAQENRNQLRHGVFLLRALSYLIGARSVNMLNRYAEELFGFPRREVLGQSVIGTTVPASESSGRDLDNMMQHLLSTPGRFLKNRNENVTADGKRITVLWTNHALLDRHGNVNSVLSVGIDLPDEPPAPAESPAPEDDDSIFF